MLALFTSNKISLGMIKLSFILLGLLVIGNSAVPTLDELQEIYADTCQYSCGQVNNEEEARDCREKFCPNYSSYLLTGAIIPGSTPSLVSSQHKEVEQFCAKWLIHLIEELGWHRRIRVNLKSCTCAGSTDCLLK